VSGSAGAILLAAGQGRRLGHDKSITAIAGRPVLAYGLEALLGIRDIEKVVVAVRADVKEEAKVWIGKNYPNEAKRVEVIVGGKERQDSVWEGLGALGGGVEWAVVHDAARVLTTAGLIERVMAGAKRSGAAAAARKMSDTVREADGQGNVVRLLDREGLWRMETPQVVRGTILRQGLQKARAEGKTVTDCMAAAELAGVKGILVEATEPNLKITLASDWQLAEVWLKAGNK
jgi:2-C-methyl-D-erythritol 4-phosphate cytidylyltransferase